MMFTDEDLKRLKGYSLLLEDYDNTVIMGGELKALLHRLECAENFVRSVLCNDATVKQDRYLDAWEQSKGAARE